MYVYTTCRCTARSQMKQGGGGGEGCAHKEHHRAHTHNARKGAREPRVRSASRACEAWSLASAPAA
eukprot:3996544-Prymnesium_polylepis.1